MPVHEPRQGRKAAALRGSWHVPQVTPGRGGVVCRPHRCPSTVNPERRAPAQPVPYQVLARKWRPQTFDEVVGQLGVTQTLRNAITGDRLGQAFIFAGARGVGKTTTARILAKALNCVNGPTVTPCGTCDACVEIAEGRDMDVLEIDAATHTGVDNVREVIISGLGVRPARDRFKIFIIDEVHMLSTSSFNALLKSVEEPPPHVVFIMATTELHKIPDTIRSRAQEFEFRTIGTRAIAEQLRTIAGGEGVEVEPAALHLIARSAEGSLRDAESAFDQVIAFAGDRITAADAAAVLGLAGRDFLLDVVDTVADEDAPRVFDLAGRAVEAGLDLRLVCRELSRLVRDLLVVAIDPKRLDEPELAPEGDLDRLQAASARFSREDLLRAFDILSKAELDIRTSPQPRHHFEMALLKWIYVRGLVPLAALAESLGRGGARAGGIVPPARAAATTTSTPMTSAVRRLDASLGERRAARESAGSSAPGSPGPDAPAGGDRPPVPARSAAPDATSDTRQAATAIAPTPAATPAASGRPLQDAVLDELRRTRKLFFGTVVAQASTIAIEGDVLTFGFAPQHKVLKAKLEQDRPMIEALAQQVAGRRISVVAVDVAPGARESAKAAASDEQERLKQRALADSAVQAMLDVFPAEIREIEEIDEP
jgi:DNA polymerase-3 subunit gamma/tau